MFLSTVTIIVIVDEKCLNPGICKRQKCSSEHFLRWPSTKHEVTALNLNLVKRCQRGVVILWSAKVAFRWPKGPQQSSVNPMPQWLTRSLCNVRYLRKLLVKPVIGISQLDYVIRFNILSFLYIARIHKHYIPLMPFVNSEHPRYEFAFVGEGADMRDIVS